MLLYGLLMAVCGAAQESPYTYGFFTNSHMKDNYFFSSVSVQSPSILENSRGRIPVSDTVFHTPGNALRLKYTNGIKGNWKATINRSSIRGQDHFRPFRFLSFWIYVATSATTWNDLPVIQFQNTDKSLSSKGFFGDVRNNVWQRVTIPADVFVGIDSLHPETIAAIIFAQRSNDGGQHEIFIDDIELVPEVKSSWVMDPPVLLSATGYARHVEINWKPVTDSNVRFVKIYRSENGGTFEPAGIQIPMLSWYADYTGKTGANYQYKIAYVDDNYHESERSRAFLSKTVPLTDDEFLDMVQRACFRYYWDGAEPTSGLAREDIPGRGNMIATGASGFGIMALIVGTERHFISRQEAIDRFTRIVHFLDTAETFHGAYPHFIDGPTGKVEPFFGSRDNGGDLVETSFLMQGLLAARSYFSGETDPEKDIRDGITRIWQRVEWNWYRRFPDSKYLYWHWSPDQGWIINHRLIGWNETMVTYLLAIASPTHAVPASMYYSGWASQETFAQQYRKGWGGTTDGSRYRNGKTYFDIKLDVGVSNGGPLFFTHYSYMGYDPHAITDKYTNYFKNNQDIARINYRYCVQNPNHHLGYGDSCWGLSASDGPFDYSADEPIQNRDPGKIPPTGAVSSFPYTPAESMKALKNYYNNYGSFLWGAYGFYDAFNLDENWCSDIYMGLNQAPMVVMIENERTGLIWKLFMRNKDIQDGLQRLEEETRR